MGKLLTLFGFLLVIAPLSGVAAALYKGRERKHVLWAGNIVCLKSKKWH